MEGRRPNQEKSCCYVPNCLFWLCSSMNVTTKSSITQDHQIVRRYISKSFCEILRSLRFPFFIFLWQSVLCKIASCNWFAISVDFICLLLFSSIDILLVSLSFYWNNDLLVFICDMNWREIPISKFLQSRQYHNGVNLFQHFTCIRLLHKRCSRLQIVQTCGKVRPIACFTNFDIANGVKEGTEGVSCKLPVK